MKDELRGELGGQCEMLAGGDGQGNSLWSSRIAEGLLRQAGLDSVTMPQNDAGSLKEGFNTRVVDLALKGGEARLPGAEPAPEPAAPALRDVAPKAPGSSLG